jgi:hypothetical protein
VAQAQMKVGVAGQHRRRVTAELGGSPSRVEGR